MKISLRWVFDYIAGVDFGTIDITDLVRLFNQKVAEIEFSETVFLPHEKIMKKSICPIVLMHKCMVGTYFLMRERVAGGQLFEIVAVFVMITCLKSQ
jgi:hypothetical protein